MYPLSFIQVDLEPRGKIHMIIELEGSSSEGEYM